MLASTSCSDGFAVRSNGCPIGNYLSARCGIHHCRLQHALSSHIEPDEEDVSVLNDVVASLDAKQAVLFHGMF